MNNILKNKYPILAIIFIILSILVYFQFYRVVPNKEVSDVKQKIETQKEEKIYRALDGVEIKNKKDINERVIGIMVENNYDAWPLSGLDKASIVYEALAEGRIPRFLALFSYSDIPDKIGPVRSARTYFLQLNKPFQAPYLHVGGSPDALKKIKTYNIIDVNQFFNGFYFWRSDKRNAPHNVYTSGKLIYDMIKNRDISINKKIETWKYKDGEVNPYIGYVKDIVVNYTNNTYQAKYVYDYKNNRYQRFQAKEPMELLDGSNIFVDNVIVEEHKHEVYDSVGRRNIYLIGSGKVWVFRDGKVIEGIWSRNGINKLTRYYDENNKEITLNRGKTWINIVEEGSFEYSNL